MRPRELLKHTRAHPLFLELAGAFWREAAEEIDNAAMAARAEPFGDCLALKASDSRGAPLGKWERTPGRRAESLDCMVYAMAVRALIGVDMERREADLGNVSGSKKEPGSHHEQMARAVRGLERRRKKCAAGHSKGRVSASARFSRQKF